MGVHTTLSESSAFRKPTKQNVRIAKAKTRIQMDSVVRASAFRMKKKKKKKKKKLWVPPFLKATGEYSNRAYSFSSFRWARVILKVLQYLG